MCGSTVSQPGSNGMIIHLWQADTLLDPTSYIALLAEEEITSDWLNGVNRQYSLSGNVQ